ncbi:MAG: MBL fold metallo-hydrolase [Lentisphaeria bacterium]|nr:MBL fold metallo-hydrolase [Lentisphaeria bacterium]
MPDYPFNTVIVGLLEVNCNLVQLPGSRTLYIIDPGGDWKLIESESRKFDYDEAVILFTHAHVDHISGAGEIADALNIRRVYLNPDDKFIYYSPSNTVGGYIPAAEDLPDTIWPPNDPRMQVILCPGHSPGGVSYYFPEIATVFSGDTLFYESIGRTDLPGGDQDALESTVRTRLFTLPDDTRVVPGHGPFTSIGFERKNNPYVV